MKNGKFSPIVEQNFLEIHFIEKKSGVEKISEKKSLNQGNPLEFIIHSTVSTIAIGLE